MYFCGYLLHYAQEVAAHLFEQANVALVLPILQGVSIPALILMAVGAYEFEGFAVEVETRLRIKMVVSQSEAGGCFIYHPSAAVA